MCSKTGNDTNNSNEPFQSDRIHSNGVATALNYQSVS